MRQYGMDVRFVSRDQYRDKETIATTCYHDYYLVPEGGRSPEGVRGASEILSHANNESYTHVVCSTGTGTTLAGLIQAGNSTQQFVGICALKIGAENNSIEQFVRSAAGHKMFTILYNYHFGGYAKKTNELIAFMNSLYSEENIPTDFVYTGKMFFAIHDLVVNDYFPAGSRVLLLHTGGLQGNQSLPNGTLVF